MREGKIKKKFEFSFQNKQFEINITLIKFFYEFIPNN